MIRSAALWWSVLVAVILVALWLLDRLLLWMERREWIYWRRRQGTPSRASAIAALELQALLEPEKRYVLVLKKEEKTLADDQGGPPDPGLPRSDS